jgi:hypothetical protein
MMTSSAQQNLCSARLRLSSRSFHPREGVLGSPGTSVRHWRDSKTRAAHGPLMRRMAQKLSC